MEATDKIKQATSITIAYLYALLFTYAAFAKMFDYENFRVQLGQSPLLSAFASWIAIAVPVGELLITILLLYPKYRLLGLYCSFVLMTMFTAYIYIILNYSAFVPCSCGGILEKMTWSQHLVFNIVFVTLALIGVLVMPLSSENHNNKMTS